jgi:flagellar basal body-associated protein FliL
MVSEERRTVAMEPSDRASKIIDIIVKLCSAGLITAIIAFYGNLISNNQQHQMEENRRMQMLIEISSKQKEFDVNLGVHMVETLMNRYFQMDRSGEGVQQPLQEKMVLLRLIALNLQDVPVNLKPLFEQLDSQLQGREDREELREVAKEIARRQASRLAFPDGFDSGVIPLKAGEERSFESFIFKLRVESASEELAKITLHLEEGERVIGPFSVTYFDLPLVDNTKIGPLRVAILLVDSNADGIDLRVIAFPSDLAADRFDIKEMSRTLRTTQW